MERPINLVLFGDQTVEKLSSIRSLVRNSKVSPGARRFLREATDTLQLHLTELSKVDRAWNGNTHSLLGIAEENVAETNHNGVIATVLMCIGRLGELIVHLEEKPSILGSEEEPTQVLAFCTGLLPAAALLAARDTSELFDIGIEIISITFRLAYEVIQNMKLIEDTKLGWAITLVGKTPRSVQLILDDFHDTKRIPYTKRVAIGVVSDGWLTLIGAPSSLSSLMDFSDEINRAPKTFTDTDGAVHTLYMPKVDIGKILGSSYLLDTPITSKARLVSPGSCKQYNHNTLKELLSEIVIDIAHNVLYINKTIKESFLGFTNTKSVALTVAGPTGHLATVQRILQHQKIDYNIRQYKTTQSRAIGRGGSELVAIVGMSGRFPGSETIEGFFEDLLEGKRLVKKVPESRFDLGKYFDSTGEKRNTTQAQYGAFLDHPGHFDNRLFNISPREAAQMDPIQRLLLMTSYEALETAGYSKDATLSTEGSRIATYFGQISEDWRDILNNGDIDIYYVPSLSRAFGPSRVSYHHKWGGGTYALDAACATSATAIHLACTALISRECDTALAGGGSILASPNTFSGLSKSGMISDKGGCMTFHDDADGYVRGEGIGVVVLKRFEDAVADNDNILGVIRGSARTYSTTSTSITHPSAQSQAQVYEEILRKTAIMSNEIAYVEMHGTGTQAGDYEEMTSVINVMGRERSKDNVLTVGAVKASVGHGEGAAGVTSLIKVLMMIKERKIPPQPGIPFRLNHNFPKLENLHVQIAGLANSNSALKASPAAADGKIKCVVNSFDASGGNTSMVVEEPPELQAKAENPLVCHVVAISAKTIISLQENRRRLLGYLRKNPDTKIADLAYTTTARRMHEVLRIAYCAGSTKELIHLLSKDLTNTPSSDPKTKPPPTSLIFAFTGQSSQYAGMGKQFYQHSAAFRNLLFTYNQMAVHQGLPHFIHLITGEVSDISNASAVCVQLAIVALEIAITQLLKSWGVEPDCVIGHSLGEYPALCVAGVLSVSDTLLLVGRRAQLMEDELAAGAYAMLAIPEDTESVRQLLAADSEYRWSNTEIACMNAPQITVVSGPSEEIAALKSSLEKSGTRATLLNVPYGFHSRHIEPILEEFGSIASGITFSAPNIPVVSTLLAKVIPAGKNGVFSASYLTQQARDRVDFIGAVKVCDSLLASKPPTQWLEIGPEPVCIGLARRTLNVAASQLLPTMKSKEDNWTTVSTTLASLYKSGISIHWPQYYKEFRNSVSLIPIPTYAFDVKNYWTTYIEHAIEATPLFTENAMGRSSSLSPVPSFSTTSLQWIEEEKLEKQSVSVTFASHTSDPNLLKAIQGHVVNGVPVCSLSIFCDMAKTAAAYAFRKLKPNKAAPTMHVLNINIDHALVVPELDPGLITRTTVLFSLDRDKATVSFVSDNLGHTVHHGSCEVLFEDSHAWFAQLTQTQFLINARIQSLKDMSAKGKAHRLLKSVAYKLFENVVTYSKDFQGMEEVWVDAECHDAVATVKLPKVTGSGNFTHSPFWIDTAIHLVGFLLNGGLKYPEDIACLSTGFESWRVLKELQPDGVYTTYVSMHQTSIANTLSGSAYVYNSDQELIQATTGIKFLKVKRVVLNTILRPTSSSSAVTQKAMVRFDALASVPKITKPLNNGSETPDTQLSNYFSDEQRSLSSRTSSTAASLCESNDPNLFDKFLAIVATESACSVEDMVQSTAFAEMGIDSLMSITVLATLQRDTGVELPATFLLDHPTVGDVKAALHEEEQTETIGEPIPDVLKPHEIISIATVSDTDETDTFHNDEPEEDDALEQELEPKVSILATSPGVTELKMNSSCLDKGSKMVLLQGSPSSNGPKLFFLPDSSGSTYRYINVPTLGTEVNVYGLESPFLKNPSEYKCDLNTICDAFVAAIRSVQNTGPYNISGFSVGAIYAYVVAQKLIKDNEEVSNLIVIEMSVPNLIGEGLLPTEEQLKECGMLPSRGRQTKAQKDHVSNTLQAITSQRLSPCGPGKGPKRSVLISSKTEPTTRKQFDLARWMQGSDDVSRGWEEMVGNVERHDIDADHLSIMNQPAVTEVGALLARTLESSAFTS